MLTTEHLLQAFEAAGASSGITYLSVPVTSGPREVDLISKAGVRWERFRQEQPDRLQREVIEPNIADADLIARSMREADTYGLVVDPSQLMVRGWLQDDYNRFWVQLMQRYAKKVVAGPGWNLSRGARGEIAFAVFLGLRVITTEGRQLQLDELLEQDANARAGLHAAGWTPTDIDQYLPTLDIASKPSIEDSSASKAFSWLVAERSYQIAKFGVEQDDQHTQEGLDYEGWWWQQLTNYYHRAKTLGLDVAVGRQALAKFVATGCGLLESVIRVHGPLPPPGVSSGETGGMRE